MTKDYADERRAAIIEIIDPNEVGDSDRIDQLARYVEAEVDAAFKRGVEWARRSTGIGTAARQPPWAQEA